MAKKSSKSSKSSKKNSEKKVVSNSSKKKVKGSSSSKADNSKNINNSKKFLANKEFNLYTYVVLLAAILLLMSGVLYFVVEYYQNSVNAYQGEVIRLSEDLNKYELPEEFLVYRYNFSEFSKAVKVDINSIQDIENYLNEMNFTIILNSDDLFKAEKIDSSCFESSIRSGRVCRDIEFSVDLSKEKEVEIIIYMNRKS